MCDNNIVARQMLRVINEISREIHRTSSEGPSIWTAGWALITAFIYIMSSDGWSALITAIPTAGGALHWMQTIDMRRALERQIAQMELAFEMAGCPVHWERRGKYYLIAVFRGKP